MVQTLKNEWNKISVDGRTKVFEKCSTHIPRSKILITWLTDSREGQTDDVQDVLH